MPRMDFPVHAFVPMGGDPPLTILLHAKHRMHDGSIFAMHSGALFQAVGYGCIKKVEQMDPNWEQRYAHHDSDYTSRLRENHATATEFCAPPHMHSVFMCPLLDIDPIDWLITEKRRAMRKDGFVLYLHASEATVLQGERRHLSLALDFQHLVAL